MAVMTSPKKISVNAAAKNPTELITTTDTDVAVTVTVAGVSSSGQVKTQAVHVLEGAEPPTVVGAEGPVVAGVRSCSQNALKIEIAAAMSVELPGDVHCSEAAELRDSKDS